MKGAEVSPHISQDSAGLRENQRVSDNVVFCHFPQKPEGPHLPFTLEDSKRGNMSWAYPSQPT